MLIEKYRYTFEVTSLYPSENDEKALNSPKFEHWIQRVMKQKNTTITKLEIQCIDMFGPIVGFIKLKMFYTDTLNPKAFPTIVFIRGGAVTILLNVVDKDDDDNKEKWMTVFTSQNRPAYGHPETKDSEGDMLELPAGMLDDKVANPINVVLKELEEEVNISAKADQLVYLGKMIPSPGACDEYIECYYLKLRKTAEEIAVLNGSKTGERHLGEAITIKLIPWNKGHDYTNDAKYQSCMFLYNTK